MNTTILQVPISKALRTEALAIVKEDGFSSLQEAVRVFLAGLVNKKVTITFEKYPTVALSAKNDKRYNKMVADFDKGVNVKSFDNVDDLMNDLTS